MVNATARVSDRVRFIFMVRAGAKAKPRVSVRLGLWLGVGIELCLRYGYV